MIQMSIEPPQRQQFLVRAALDNFALVDHQNHIGRQNSGETVRNDQGRAALHQDF